MNKLKLLITTIALLLSVGITQNANAAITDGLVAHWSFDDCTGKDVSGNNHDAKLDGQAPQCVTGKNGKAIAFSFGMSLPPETSGYVSVSELYPTLQVAPVTMVAWIKPHSDFDWYILKDLNLTNKPSLSSKDYSQLVFVFDSDYHFKIYLNNKLVNETSYSSVLRINDLFDNFYDAYIDDVSIYNRALSQDEIATLYTGKEKEPVKFSDNYIKIANDGSELPNSATLGTNPKDWACTKDKKTGLIWEVKTDDGGLRDKDLTYSWYEPDMNKNGGFAGYQNGRDDYGNRNTYSYVNAVNEQALCGAKNWRLPNHDELKSLVYCSDNNKTDGASLICTGSPASPTIDVNYFPDVINKSDFQFFWSSLSHGSNDGAWFVKFDKGSVGVFTKDSDGYIRLVQPVETDEPIVTSITPKTTVVGSPTVFTVTGKNLTDGMGFTVGDCALSNAELADGTSEKRQFICTQYGDAGKKRGLVKTKPGGTTLNRFDVQAKTDNVPEIYAATDKKILKTAGETVSILLSTTVQKSLDTAAAYDVYLKFTQPDETVLYDDGKQLTTDRKPYLTKFKIKKASDWSDLLQYSIPKGAAEGAYHVNVELWSPKLNFALSKSNTMFVYEPTIGTGQGSSSKSQAAMIGGSSGNSPVNPNDKVKKYKDECKKDYTVGCITATKDLLALQLGTKYFEKLGGVDGVIGAYGIFKKGESALKNLYMIDDLLNVYWEYESNDSLTSDQRMLLVSMKVANEFLKGKISYSLGDVADALELTLTKMNGHYKAIAKDDNEASGVDIDIRDDCFFGCDVKTFELVPIFYLEQPWAGAGLENTPISQYKHNDTTADNISSRIITKEITESSAGWGDYYFGKIPLGLYIATVHYKNGEVYRQPVLIDKSLQTYVITTARD